MITENEKKDLKYYIEDITNDNRVITTVEQRVIAMLCKDLLARKERDALDDAPPQIHQYSHMVPIHTVAKLLMDLSDELKHAIDLHYDMLFKEQRDDMKKTISKACEDFDKEIRNHIVGK